MKLTFYCKVVDLNWAAVTEVPSRLSRFGLTVKSVKLELSRFPLGVESDSIEYLLQYVTRNGPPKSYSISLWGPENGGSFNLHLFRLRAIDGEPVLTISLESKSPDEPLKSAMELLGLQADDIQTATALPRTVFIAHRFDDV